MLTTAMQQRDIVSPGAAELLWGGVAFFVVAAVLVWAVALVVKRGTRRAGNEAVEHWRERALRAEAQLEFLAQERKDA